MGITTLGPLMIDVEGTILSQADRKRLLHPAVGGIILFARNFENPEQVKQLTTEIRALRSPQLLIAVDHEGGRVQRFRFGFTQIPPMASLGELWEKDQAAALAEAKRYGALIAQELLEVGIDFSFTPVLDLNYGTSEVIGNRAFHRDPATVSHLAAALCKGLNAEGMIGVAKHFPGHGYVEADSHVAIPIDTRCEEEIMEDIQPFQFLVEKGVEAIMPAHVIYPAIDKNPAGFSSIWLQSWLREKMGFKGFIFSDDVSMEGASVAGATFEERARAALSAGCDGVLICNHMQEVDIWFESLAVDAFSACEERWEPLRAKRFKSTT
ncbi:MAG: beta-N-acetylhexosaminidase [Pseudomonadota bacterium]